MDKILLIDAADLVRYHTGGAVDDRTKDQTADFPVSQRTALAAAGRKGFGAEPYTCIADIFIDRFHGRKDRGQSIFPTAVDVGMRVHIQNVDVGKAVFFRETAAGGEVQRDHRVVRVKFFQKLINFLQFAAKFCAAGFIRQIPAQQRRVIFDHIYHIFQTRVLRIIKLWRTLFAAFEIAEPGKTDAGTHIRIAEDFQTVLMGFVKHDLDIFQIQPIHTVKMDGIETGGFHAFKKVRLCMLPSQKTTGEKGFAVQKHDALFVQTHRRSTRLGRGDHLNRIGQSAVHRRVTAALNGQLIFTRLPVGGVNGKSTQVSGSVFSSMDNFFISIGDRKSGFDSGGQRFTGGIIHGGNDFFVRLIGENTFAVDRLTDGKGKGYRTDVESLSGVKVFDALDASGKSDLIITGLGKCKRQSEINGITCRNFDIGAVDCCDLAICPGNGLQSHHTGNIAADPSGKHLISGVIMGAGLQFKVIDMPVELSKLAVFRQNEFGKVVHIGKR